MPPKAGIFAGEVTTAAPADGAATLKQKGYQWMEYGNTTIPYVPESSYGGHSATHDHYFAEPHLPHPLVGNVYSEWTESITFKAATAPINSSDTRSLLSFSWPSLFQMQQYGALTGKWWLAVSFVSSNSIGFGAQSVCNAALRLDHDTATESIGGGLGTWTEYNTEGWGPLDWYTVTATYSQPLNRFVVSWVNLTRGEEVISEFGTGVLDTFGGEITNNIDVSFVASTYGSLNSMVVWGASSVYSTGVPADPYDLLLKWDGYISNIFIHGKYVDLADEDTRRKFSAIDGLISTGDNGEIPFGEAPMVYMPSGGPWENLGTQSVGNYPEDFLIRHAPTYNVVIPPVP